jgi:hypothetical protein
VLESYLSLQKVAVILAITAFAFLVRDILLNTLHMDIKCESYPSNPTVSVCLFLHRTRMLKVHLA